MMTLKATEDGLEEERTEERQLGKILKSSTDTQEFQTKAAKVGTEKRELFERHFWGRIDNNLSNSLWNQ